MLLNNGDGSFQAKRDYATGVNPESVAIGDLNGDGKADLVTANEGPPAGTVSVLIERWRAVASPRVATTRAGRASGRSPSAT